METIKDIEKKLLEDVSQGRDSNNEENVKIKIIVPLLKALGWKDSEMDFESSVKAGKIDILLKIEQIPRLIIEVKSLEKDLEVHREQAFNYAKSKGIKDFILTNGITFNFFKITKNWKDVEIKDLKPFDTIKKEELTEKEGILRYYIGRDELGILLAHFEISVNTNYLELRKILNDLKIALFLDLREKIRFLYQNDKKYKIKLDNWIEEINWDFDWEWTDNFTRKIINKSLKRKIENILELKLTKEWFKVYKSPKNEDYRKEINDKLCKNGFTLDIFDKFALEGAYTLINRILFIRIFETNTGKSYFGREFLLQLDKLTSTKAIFHLIQAVFEEIALLFEKIYKSPIFNDTFLEEIEWDKEIILKIIETFINFDFTNLKIDLIGRLYEENLDRDIKNSIGQFYTPRLLIQFIMDQLNFEEIVDDIENDMYPMILDPACGSGGFLIAFYDNVKKVMLQRKWDNIEIFKILTNIIYGLDIDNFAVQLSNMNLLIKEAISNLKEISTNIYQMNSVKFPLVDAQQFIAEKQIPNGISLISSENRKKDGISISELKKTRFRYIFGNPPFFEIKKNRFPSFDYLYPMLTADSKPNIASMFLVRFVNFLEEGGILAFIFPASILFSDAFINTRKYIVENYRIIKIVQLGRAFSDVGLEQIIIFLQKLKPTDNHLVEFIYDIESFSEKKYKTIKSKQADYISDLKFRLRVFLDRKVIPFIKRIENNSTFLGDLCFTYIPRGTKVKGREIAIFRGMGWEKHLKNAKAKGITTPAIKGTNIMRYGVKSTYFIPNKLRNKSSKKLDLILKQPKIGIQRLVSSKTRIVATRIDSNLITISTIENIFLKPDCPYEIDFIVGILNSELITYYIIDHVFMRSKLTTSLDKEYVRLLPIPNISKIEQNELIKIVKKLKEIVKDGIINGNMVNDIEESNEFKKEENKLNEKIYQYYGLNNTEISIIKERIKEFYVKA